MIIFIYGSDSYRAWQKLQEIRAKFKEKIDASGSSTVSVEGEDFDMNILREQLLSPALFAKERMVIIKNLFQQRLHKKIQEQIIEILGKADDNVVIFWDQVVDKEQAKKMKTMPLFKFLAATKYVQVYDRLDDRRLTQWVQERARELGGDISPGLARTLVSMLGNDLWYVDNELQKLILYKNGEPLTNTDVDELVKARFDADIWQFTDALARRDVARALQLFNNQLATGTDTSELFYKMVWQFRILLMIKETQAAATRTSAEIARELDLHPFVVQKSLPLVKQFTREELRALFSKLGRIDINMKASGVEPEFFLDLFMIGLKK